MAQTEQTPPPAPVADPPSKAASPPTPALAAKQPRDAIIFIPGIGTQWNDQSLENISGQIAKAIDLADAEPGARYQSEMHLVGLRGHAVKVCTISRRATEAAPPEPAVDVVVMDYRESLKKWFNQKPILMKCLLVFFAILTVCSRLVKGRFAPSNRKKQIKSGGEKTQLIWASFMLWLLSCYLVLLLMAVGASCQELAHGAFRSSADTTNSVVVSVTTNAPAAGQTNEAATVVRSAITNKPENPQPAKPDKSEGKTQWLWTKLTRWWGWAAKIVGNIFTNSPWLFILATLLGVAAPAKWRGMVEDASADYVCLLCYMSYGTRRNAIIGEFNEFVEGFYEWTAVSHRKVHVFAYSFGSIIALDALFPAGASPARRVQNLDTLVTIGCPFDVIRLTWPQYFSGRTNCQGTPRPWLNIYSTNDVISSNFRNDDLEGEAQESVECAQGSKQPPPKNVAYKEGPHGQDLSFLETVVLMGLRSHAMYWDESCAAERNCFTYIVDEWSKRDGRSDCALT